MDQIFAYPSGFDLKIRLFDQKMTSQNTTEYIRNPVMIFKSLISKELNMWPSVLPFNTATKMRFSNIWKASFLQLLPLPNLSMRSFTETGPGKQLKIKGI